MDMIFWFIAGLAIGATVALFILWLILITTKTYM